MDFFLASRICLTILVFAAVAGTFAVGAVVFARGVLQKYADDIGVGAGILAIALIIGFFGFGFLGLVWGGFAK